MTAIKTWYALARMTCHIAGLGVDPSWLRVVVVVVFFLSDPLTIQVTSFQLIAASTPGEFLCNGVTSLFRGRNKS